MSKFKQIAAVTCSAVALTGIACSPTFAKWYIDKKQYEALKLESVYRSNSLHHPQSKYLSEIVKSYNGKSCIVFGDNSCGSVDCINEAAFTEQLPTIVLDSRTNSLSDAVSQYLKKLELRSTLFRSLARVASFVSSKRRGGNWLVNYMDSMPFHNKLHWFESIIKSYPTHEIPSLSEETLPVHRSCVVVWRVPSLTTVSEQDMEIWQHLQDLFPYVLFIITCNHGPIYEHESIPNHTASLYNLPIVGLAPLSNEERDEVIGENDEKSAVRTILDFTSGYWDDAMDLLQWVKDPSSAIDDCHKAVNAKVDEMKSFLSSVFQQLTFQPSVDAVYLFSLLSGVLKDALIVGQEGVASMLDSSHEDSLSGQFASQAIEHLQTLYFLPPVFSNTTFGAVGIKDSVQFGHSDILQQLLHRPSIQSILSKAASLSLVSDEHLATMDITEDSQFEYLEMYSHVKSGNATRAINTLLSTNLLRLHLLKPLFCPTGWGELMPSLFLSPHSITAAAFDGLKEEVGVDKVVSEVRSSQRVLMKTKEMFLRRYYERQLESEYRVLCELSSCYQECLTDAYTIEDWLQGLIELGNLSTEFYLHTQLLVKEVVDRSARVTESQLEEQKTLSVLYEQWSRDLKQRNEQLFEAYRQALKERRERERKEASSWW